MPLLEPVAIIAKHATMTQTHRFFCASQNTPTPTPIVCGGIQGIGCPSGMVCQYSNGSRIPPYPDATGICVVQPTRVTPTPTCIPRPTCLDSNPQCLLPEPIGGWCPGGTPTPPPYIRVLTPNGGEQLVAGQPYTISWQASPGIPNYAIYLVNEANQYSLINTAQAPNTTYLWTVGSPIMTSTGRHKIKIVNGSQGGSDTLPLDISDNYFTITRPGDANGDGRVDGVDYVIWLNHYNQQVSGASNGDFNGDGRVDGVDYVIWVNNY